MVKQWVCHVSMGLMALSVVNVGAVMINRNVLHSAFGMAFQRPLLLQRGPMRPCLLRGQQCGVALGTSQWGGLGRRVIPARVAKARFELRAHAEGHGHGHAGHAHTHSHTGECDHLPGETSAAPSTCSHEQELESANDIVQSTQSHKMAAVSPADSCSHEHGHEHSRSHSREHSHQSSSQPVASIKQPAGNKPSSSLSSSSSLEEEEPPRVSSSTVLKGMVDSFLADGGAAAVVCFVIICLTKAVKVAVPFLYQYVLDLLTTGTFAGPAVLHQLLAPVTAVSAGSGGTALALVGALVVLHTASKITAQALQSANDVLFSKAVQPAVRRSGRKALGTLLDMPMSFHVQSSTGGLTRAMERGIRAVSTVLSRLILHLAPQALELTLVAGIIAWKAGLELALAAVVTVMAYAAFTIYTVDQRTRFIAQMNRADNQATNRMLDGLIHVETVASYNKQEFEVARYDQSLQSYQKAQLQSQITLASLNWGQKAIESLGLGYLLLRTAFMVMNGQMTVGEMVMINALLAQMMGPLDHLGANYMQLQQGMEDARDMFTIIDKKKDQDAKSDHPPLAVTAGAIRFDNVHFGYKSTPDSDQSSGHAEHVLCGFDLEVSGGSTVAIVGESGCGKSTVTRLLTGSYNADSGKITVDGQDVGAVTPDSLRESVAVVQQEASLFNEDLWYNIMYGSKDGQEDKVVAAAKTAQLQPLVHDLDDGYQTKVGERGLLLSGGQRQRVALARALLKEAPILVCDEATSALDVNTEGKVMDALADERKGKTTIIIAHRLSTVTSADKILVMEGGRVVEQGSHAELLADATTRYASMWNKQLEDDTPPKEAQRPSLVPVVLEMDDPDSSSGHAGCSSCGH